MSATVSSIPSTKNTFLPFYQASGVTQTGSAPHTAYTCLDDNLAVELTNAYEKSVLQSAPILLPNDEMQILTNFSTATLASDVTFEAFWEDTRTPISAGITIAPPTLITDPVNNFVVHIARTSTRAGYMRIAIKDGNDVLFLSKRIYLSKSTSKKGTVYLEYYTSGTYYGFPFNNDPNRRNRVRILGNLADVQYPSEYTEYRSDVNNSFYRSNIYLDRVLGLETQYFDRDMHAAMAVALACTTISMNAVNVIPSSAYQPTFDKYRTISIGKVTLKEVNFSSLNSNCTTITQTDDNLYYVAVIREGDWQDVVSGANGLYAFGTSVTLSIGVNDLDAFTKFTKMDGTLLTTSTSYTFTVTGDTTIKAIY